MSGSELAGVDRYPGFVRSHYVREARKIERRYVGPGDLRAVLDHYASQLKAAGYVQEVVAASPQAERHRFVRPSDEIDLEIRRDATNGRIEVILADVIR